MRTSLADQPTHDSALAQLVEQMTVNHWVAGSSPAGGAIITFSESLSEVEAV